MEAYNKNSWVLKEEESFEALSAQLQILGQGRTVDISLYKPKCQKSGFNKI